MLGRDFAAAVAPMVKLWKQTLSADERMTERSDAATSGSGMFTLRFIQCLPCSPPIVLVPWWVRRLHLVETDSWLHYGVFVVVQQRPPPPQYNLYAHTLGIIGLPVPPGGYLPGITSSTIPPDGDKLPTPPHQNGSKEDWISRRAQCP